MLYRLGVNETTKIKKEKTKEPIVEIIRSQLKKKSLFCFSEQGIKMKKEQMEQNNQDGRFKFHHQLSYGNYSKHPIKKQSGR